MVMRMKKYFIVFLIIYIFFGCKEKSVELAKKEHIKIEKKQNIEADIDKQQKLISSNEFVYLFFSKLNFINTEKPSKNSIKNELLMNSSDLKVIVDWQVEGGRNIKIKNNKTGNIFTIREGNNAGEITLVERNLRYYLFKIENTIIKVPR